MMKINKLVLIAFISLANTNVSLADDNGKELFEKLCLSCHGTADKPTTAPPIFGVINHVKSAHPEKDDFVNYIVNWVANPNSEMALMPGAVRKFGLMPKLPYKAADVRLIAEYLYEGETELPSWYIEHYEAEHGHAPKQ